MDFEQYEILTSDLLEDYTSPFVQEMTVLRERKISLKKQLDDIEAAIAENKTAYYNAKDRAIAEVHTKFKFDVFRELPKIADHPDKEELFSLVWDECDGNREKVFEELEELSDLFLNI
jgi:hypothetical protein